MKESPVRKTIVGLALLAVVAITLEHVAQGQGRQGRGSAPAPAGQAAPAPARGRGAPPQPVFPLEDHFLDWRLMPGEKAYESIDGKRMLGYVSDLAAMSRRYRDAGH